MFKFFWGLFLFLSSEISAANVCENTYMEMANYCVYSREADLDSSIKDFQTKVSEKLAVQETKQLLDKMLNLLDTFSQNCSQKTAACINSCLTVNAEYANQCDQIQKTKVAQAIGAKQQIQLTLQKLDSTVQMVVVDINVNSSQNPIDSPNNPTTNINNHNQELSVAPEEKKELFRNVASLQKIYGSDLIGVSASDNFENIQEAYQSILQMGGFEP